MLNAPGGSGGTSGKVSDGYTRLPLLFEDEGIVHKQGRPTRGDWRAPETGGDAALARSAGGAAPGAAGWRAKGPVGLGQWSTASEREAGIAEPACLGAPLPAGGCGGEFSCSAGELRQRALSFPPGRGALDFSRRALSARQLRPSFMYTDGPELYEDPAGLILHLLQKLRALPSRRCS